LLPSGRFSWLALAVAALLAAILLALFGGVHSPAAGLLLSDILQCAIALWAAFCAFYVARQSKGYLRQLWLLLGSALSISTSAQVLETYYQNIAHLPSTSPWPSDILFLFWVIPAILMFLPRPSEESTGINWLQVLDFAQIGVVALTAYLYFFYVPSRWEVEGPQMILKVLRLVSLCGPPPSPPTRSEPSFAECPSSFYSHAQLVFTPFSYRDPFRGDRTGAISPGALPTCLWFSSRLPGNTRRSRSSGHQDPPGAPWSLLKLCRSSFHYWFC
jgi:hypothetical protein